MIEFQLIKSGDWYMQARCAALSPRWEWSPRLGPRKPSAKKQAEARKALANAFAADAHMRATEAHMRATEAHDLSDRLSAFARTVA